MSAPNIIVFFTDQQRWDTCGCYGQPLAVTPQLDRMAAAGVRFENAFTCQPICGPARACLQTGKYATEIGCPTNHCRLPPGELTLAHRLAAQGYETAYLGKWHLASCGPRGGMDDFRTRPVPPDRRGGYRDFWLAADALEFTSHAYDGHMFDADMQPRYFPGDRFRADVQTDWLIDYLENRHHPSQPFFLFASYIEPHHQNDHGHVEGPTGSRECFRDFVPPGDLKDAGGDWPVEYPDYLGCVHNLDTNLGRVREALRRLDLTERTLLVFTSDHGCHFRTRNAEYKRSCHDGSIRIPLVVEGPGFGGGRVVERLCSLIDLPPTIVTAAGSGDLHAMRGLPLQRVMDANDQSADRASVFIQISESQCGRALRTRRWKYSLRAPDDTAVTSMVYREDCLYDLNADPHESNNLVARPELAGQRRRLAAELIVHMHQAGEPEPRIEPAVPSG